MKLNGMNKSKKRGIRGLTQLVRDALPEQLRPMTDDDPTDQVPALRLGPETHAPEMTVGVATDASPSPTIRPAPPAISPEADTDDGLRRLAAQSGVSLGDFSAAERATAVHRLEKELLQRLARWARMEDELRTRTAELNRLQSEQMTDRTAVETLTAQIRSLTTERDDGRRETAQLRAELADARRDSGSSLEQQRVLEQRAHELAAATDEKDRLLREAEAHLKALTSELNGHRDALVGLEHTLTDQRSTFERQEKEKAALADRISGLERKCEELRAKQGTDFGVLAQLKADLGARAREAESAAKLLESALAEQRRLEVVYQEERSSAAALLAEAQMWERAAQHAEAGRRRIEEQMADVESSSGERDRRLRDLDSVVSTLVAEKTQLIGGLEKRDTELAERLSEVSDLKQVSGVLTLRCDEQARTIDALHNQMQSQKKLIDVLSQGVSNVDEVAATVATLDAWVSHQMGGTEHHEGTTAQLPQPGVPVMEAMDEAEPLRYALSKKVFTIGRSRDSDIRIGGKYTSRHHARILNEPDNVVIEDLGSANGMMVNNSFVARCVLTHGDVVDIGGSRFRFVERNVGTNGLMS